jgi:ribosomal protein S18 acetylase RimI-like enzyme
MTHLEECKAALLNSRLGKEYFQDEDDAVSLLTEGITKGEIFVAQDDEGKCLGFIYYILKGAFNAFPYLEIIAVRQEFRGLGIGKKLLQYFEEAVFPEFPRVFLVVGDFNSKAQRLYESVGYRQVGEIPGLYREWITEHLMMKNREDE